MNTFRLRFAVAAFSLAALAGLATAPAKAQTAYAIGNGGSSLVRFDIANPGAATIVGDFSGGATFLDGIDFRPLDGQLYGYLDSSDTLYQVNTATAALTAVATGSGASATNTFVLGMDFNPRLDRARIVTDSAQNLVYNPNTNAAPLVATDLFYPATDPNGNGLGVSVIDNAYTNNRISPALTTTTQYVIDYNLDILATLANNTGALTTVGALGVNTDSYSGFDIYTSSVNQNFAYALLGDATGTTPGLYTIDLASGAAISAGAIGSGNLGQTYSLAITPAGNAAPEPGTLGLLSLGALTLLGVARRRATK